MNTSIEKYISKAIEYYNAGNYKDALAACEQAIQREATSARAYHGKGLALIQQKMHKEALEAFQMASELAPENAKIHADMAELFFTRHEYNKASQAYERAIQLDNRYKDSYEEKLNRLINRAFRLRNPYSREAAITAFRKVLLFDPENEIARAELIKLQKVMATLSFHSLGETHYANCTCPQCWEP